MTQSAATHDFPSVDDTGVLLSRIMERYEVMTETVDAGGRTYSILAVRDVNRLVDSIEPELFAIDERLPYWAELWSSALGLADWIGEMPWSGGTRVLELGCGLGLAGIAAASEGATVVMSDYDDEALMFARYNVLKNLTDQTLRSKVQLMPMDWRSPLEGLTFDVIIGADIIYERRMFSPLILLMKRYLSPGGTVMLTDPDRAIGRDFLREAAQNGFDASCTCAEVSRRARVTTLTRVLMQRKAA